MFPHGILQIGELHFDEGGYGQRDIRPRNRLELYHEHLEYKKMNHLEILNQLATAGARYGDLERKRQLRESIATGEGRIDRFRSAIAQLLIGAGERVQPNSLPQERPSNAYTPDAGAGNITTDDPDEPSSGSFSLTSVRISKTSTRVAPKCNAMPN